MKNPIMVLDTCRATYLGAEEIASLFMLKLVQLPFLSSVIYYRKSNWIPMKLTKNNMMAIEQDMLNETYIA